MTAIALTVAGSDPSGGAGLQADLKTFHQHRVYGAAVAALLTVQDDRGTHAVQSVDSGVVEAQLERVLAGLDVAAAKTGALGTAANVAAVAGAASRQSFPWVVDPVFAASGGVTLLDDDGRAILVESLIPLCTLLTPNVPEVEWLVGESIRTLSQAKEAAELLGRAGPSVLLKGGHLDEPRDEVVDVLFHEGDLREFRAPRLDRKVRGTGCALSAAITARLVHGCPLPDAVALGRRWLHRAIETAAQGGEGVPPVNHFCELPSETC